MAIKWVDRVATHPGRVQLTPVQGQTNIYDMERADEPTVAGTPVNAANLNAMQKNMGLDANMTVYVAVSGSDATGNGSSTAPYQTITKALSTIPKNLNGYSAYISVSAGTYNDDVQISGFTGGIIGLIGTAGETVTINSLVIFYSSLVVIRNFDLVVNNTNDSHAIQVYSSDFSCTTKITCSGGLSRGLHAVTFSRVFISNLIVTSASESAVRSEYSEVSLGSVSGNVLGIGFRAYGGLCALF